MARVDFKVKQTIPQHLRYTVRLLRKSPGFTITAVLILSFGIGVNTAIFSLMDAAVLKPLPFPDPDRLVEVCTPYQKEWLHWIDYPDYLVPGGGATLVRKPGGPYGSAGA